MSCEPAAPGRLREFLEFATGAALQAGAITLGYYQTDLVADGKADGSPVTAADREAEEALRRLIARAYPSHAIVGEEFGADQKGASHVWYLDPIDGTRSFVRGVPFYGVLVGLEIDGVMQVGVAHFPALGETVAAARGMGCTWNGRRARVSTTSSLSEATLVYTDGLLVEDRLGLGWAGLQDATALQRGWGDGYGHCLVATGRADVMIDPRMKAWDCAALVPILLEAGGTFTDWTGVTTIHGGDAVSTNARLAADVLGRLGA